MSTAETTVELLSAFDRLLDLLHAPQDIPFLSPMIQREIIYRILRGAGGQRLRAITAGDQSYRTAKVIAWIKDRTIRRRSGLRIPLTLPDDHVHSPSPLPVVDFHEPLQY